jgi:DNA invertase Pin-like site-specific DNA recombinase
MLLCGYFRFSPRPDAPETDSIRWQDDFITRWAIDHKRTIDRKFADEDLSGCEMTNRSGLLEAIAYCKANKRELVAYSLSRVARNLRDLLNIQFDLATHGSKLRLLDQPEDLDSDLGELSMVINGYVAQKHLRDLKRATSAGMQKKQRDGLRMSGNPPYGFTFAGDALQPLTDECAVLASIYAMSDEGASPEAIRAFLRDAGETLRSRPFRTRDVRNILRRRLPISSASAQPLGRCSG